ncbi:hypothetical protein [Oceanicoccus sagamiensis]|uniref:Uncharacterized protein n=1 Tax=Oceanicoccus sagamiensis TaxID=716816 RepID=A0A1X9NEJ4_9GAMM|nr:hypothetical protein [Oceanicoccus sagamiensis]ARN73357.1 hypothetical protein BST96_04080 [Oceanicoccus sagamiensis]
MITKLLLILLVISNTWFAKFSIASIENSPALMQAAGQTMAGSHDCCDDEIPTDSDCLNHCFHLLSVSLAKTELPSASAVSNNKTIELIETAPSPPHTGVFRPPIA